MLLERARDAKQDAARNSADPRAQFMAGRREAYYEVIATLIGQLDAFGIPKSAVGVPDNFDPEKELL